MARTEERIIRVLRPSIIVLCGPAACGKSTFALRHFRPPQVISSDACRALVCDDERNQRYNSQAFALVDFLLCQRLSLNRLCVVDSTALAPAARKSLLETGRRFRVQVVIFMFHIPLARCLERDRQRQRSVGQKVIEEHYHLFEQALASVAGEGYDRIEVLQEEDLQSVRIEILYRPVTRSLPGTAPAKRPSKSIPSPPRGPRS